MIPSRRTLYLTASLIFTVSATIPGRVIAAEVNIAPSAPTSPSHETALMKDWLARWQTKIQGESRDRSCDREMGEELGWLVSPLLNGFYYGYEAIHDPVWVDRLIDWTDSCIKRGIKEPDGYIGWPKADGASTAVVPGLYTDNILGEAMMLRPAVLMAGTILKTPSLKAKYGSKATTYIKLSEDTFTKWDSRGCWRNVKEGGVWVVPVFGIDQQTGKWTDSYARRQTDGFSLPANKQNAIARWLLAMYDVTGKAIYRERAEKWFRQMKSRMKLNNGKYFVWDYWDPAGPWDYKLDGSTKHWVGVHPNGGYYGIDVDAIVDAYQHGLVFDRADLDKLIATNRDFMWNHQVQGKQFRSIDGASHDDRWKDTPGVLWIALTPYDSTLRQVFEANHNPASWGGLSVTPWFLSHGARVIPGS